MAHKRSLLHLGLLLGLMACLPSRSFAQEEESGPSADSGEQSSGQKGAQPGSKGEEGKAAPDSTEGSEDGSSKPDSEEASPEPSFGAKSEGQMIIGEDSLKDSDEEAPFEVRKEEPKGSKAKPAEEKPKTAKKEKAAKRKKAARKAEASAEDKEPPPARGAPPKPKAIKQMEPFPILPLTPITPENP